MFSARLSVAVTMPSAGLMAMIRSGAKFQLLTNRCPAGTATPAKVIAAGSTCKPVPLAPLPGMGQVASVWPLACEIRCNWPDEVATHRLPPPKPTSRKSPAAG
jgi:hypothetical protein